LNTLLKHATGIAPVVSLDSHNKSTETSKTCESTQWQNTDEHVYSHQDPTIVQLYMSSWLSECRSTWVHLSICLGRINPNQQFMAECHHSAETGYFSYDNIWIAKICFCSYQRVQKNSDSFEAYPRKNRRRTRRLGNPFEDLEGVHLSLRGPFIAAEAAPSVSSPQKQSR
jgi:hypothetical protein